MIRHDVPRSAIEISSSGDHERRDLRRRLPRSTLHARSSFVAERMTSVWRVQWALGRAVVELFDISRAVVRLLVTYTNLC